MSIRRITPAGAPAVPNNVGLDARRLHATDHVEIVHVTLVPGQNLQRHASPVEAAFYIIEGEGTIESGSESAPVRAGELIPHPARTMHRMINNSAAWLRFLVIKTPRPTEPPTFEQ
jgi:quercetin dioxygenase-like cupin family protein